MEKRRTKKKVAVSVVCFILCSLVFMGSSLSLAAKTAGWKLDVKDSAGFKRIAGSARIPTTPPGDKIRGYAVRFDCYGPHEDAHYHRFYNQNDELMWFAEPNKRGGWKLMFKGPFNRWFPMSVRDQNYLIKNSFGWAFPRKLKGGDYGHPVKGDAYYVLTQPPPHSVIPSVTQYRRFYNADGELMWFFRYNGSICDLKVGRFTKDEEIGLVPIVIRRETISEQQKCALKILRPRVNVPVIRMPEESFLICCEDIPSAGNWKIMLLNNKKNITLAKGKTVHKNVIYDKATGASYNWTIKATIPQGTQEGLYDLLVSSSSGNDKQLRAVKVVLSYKKNFDFIHITDTHIGIKNYEISNPYLKEILSEIKKKKINPEFIIITGDNIHQGLGTAKVWWEKFLDYFSEINVPIFVCPGNHDFRDTKDYRDKKNKNKRSEEYNRYMGCRYFSFDYGKDCHFVMLDNALNAWQGYPAAYIPPDYSDQLKWADEDFSRHASSKLKAIGQHVFYHNAGITKWEKNPYMVEMPPDFLKLCNKHSIKLVIDGHAHRNVDCLFGSTPTIHLSTGSASSGFDTCHIGFGWYRVITVKNGNIVFYSPTQCESTYLHKFIRKQRVE